jgi:hypothetical protein
MTVEVLDIEERPLRRFLDMATQGPQPCPRFKRMRIMIAYLERDSETRL